MKWYRVAAFVASGLALAAAGGALVPAGKISCSRINESSGLASSRRQPGVFWTHNDSGGEPTLYAVRADGTPAGAAGCAGVRVTGAVNVDWEDLAADADGNLVVADLGNNRGDRRDLAFYVVPEPPLTAWATAPARKIPVRYADRSDPPDPDRDYDAEALFCAQGQTYVLTKRWSDARTALHRLGPPGRGPQRLLEPVATYPIQGLVTAAASPDGRRLAVLTYNAAWVFEAPEGTDRWFEGRARRLAIQAGQCEALCFDGDALLLGNEGGELFRVPLAALTPPNLHPLVTES